MPRGRSQLLDNTTNQRRDPRKDEHEQLGFFGPKDPKTHPLHMKLCLGGLLLFPLWWIGAVMRCEETDCCESCYTYRIPALMHPVPPMLLYSYRVGLVAVSVSCIEYNQVATTESVYM
ncbi:hypothetical protein AG1IA_04077 [Rhizoctonia solani AG-1 IA]|uniref:Uncharacterized protein n=1 Tax=Thanatephorus cucumeris (strain AG1-IA) TaxID=983506 RepID=L8WYR2_THACA|nr:hypothetical protein AG1IA_04077 [Rhizoctonia solani AG-1 IA]